MNIYRDERIVLTLDAGGTNFVFGAMQGGKEIVESIVLPSNAHDLEKCLTGITDGFNKVIKKIEETPSAISFAFPGPADYGKGIIGNLNNLPAFRGGIALGAMLENQFSIPVFIQNDGDLFTYGEAIGGILKDINSELDIQGSHKRYKNLVGLTLGTGFGAGIVQNGQLFAGDNSVPAEIWNIGNTITPERNAEDGVSTRAIINDYVSNSDLKGEGLMPFDIYKVATGKKEGDEAAAKKSFFNFGLHLGDAIANLIMLFDGNIVIGGGLTGAQELYMPAAMSVLKGTFANKQPRLTHEIYNLDEDQDRISFFKTTEKKIKVPFSNQEVFYDPIPKVAVASSRLGASKAIALGAYAYAISELDKLK